MPLPKTVTFTLEGKPIVRTPTPDPPPPPATDDAAPALGEAPAVQPTPEATAAAATPTFDAEYGGDFVIRIPGGLLRSGVRARAVALIQSYGVVDALGLDEANFKLFEAFAYLELLAEERPPWSKPDAPESGTTMGRIALLRAVEEADLAIEAAKKKPAGGGGAS